MADRDRELELEVARERLDELYPLWVAYLYGRSTDLELGALMQQITDEAIRRADRELGEPELGDPGSIDRSAVERELEVAVVWPHPRDDPELEPDEPWARHSRAHPPYPWERGR